MNETEYDSLKAESLATLDSLKYKFVALFILGLLALLTNPLILWTILRQKQLHTGCFILIGQMAVSDWLVGIASIATTVKRWIRMSSKSAEVISQRQCAFEMAPIYFGQSASLMLALMLGLERLLAASVPIKFKSFQWQIAYTSSIIAWLFAIIDTSAIFIDTSESEIITICTLGTALANEFESLQETEKDIITVAIVFIYALLFVTITLQLIAAKRENEHALVRMKKNLQLKMARMLIVVAIIYLLLQLVSRIGLGIIVNFPQSQRSKIAPFLRMLILLNSGINFFIYISTSTDFKEAFVKSFGLKKSPTTQSSSYRSIPT